MAPPSAPCSPALAHLASSGAARALCVLLPLLSGCAAEVPSNAEPLDTAGAVKVGAAPASPAPVLAAGSRLHTALVTGLRFPVPSTVMVEERHFDASLPTYKFRHSIRFKADRGTSVVLDVWDDPERRDLDTWFGAHLAFLVLDVTRVSRRLMARERVPGILLEEPASPQASSQAIAVFALRGQVFRVTCIDPEGNTAAREMFDGVVDQLEAGVTR